MYLPDLLQRQKSDLPVSGDLVLVPWSPLYVLYPGEERENVGQQITHFKSTS